MCAQSPSDEFVEAFRRSLADRFGADPEEVSGMTFGEMEGRWGLTQDGFSEAFAQANRETNYLISRDQLEASHSTQATASSYHDYESRVSCRGT